MQNTTRRRGKSPQARALKLLLVLAALMIVAPLQAAHADKVLILGPTVSGGASSVEAMHAVAMGHTVDIVDAPTWAAMTTADFASYRGIVLGDATCSSTAPAAAVANSATWGAAVNGNITINGTDPVFHQGSGGKDLTEKTMDFAFADAGKTGLYASLSCYYHGAVASTPVPMLDGIAGPGGFTVTGVGCFNDAHITATHPALAGLTDAILSNWSCSVHEAFDKWPASFEVLAIARNAGSAYTAPDGTVGTPYILARGAGLGVISDIKLSPEAATNPLGTPHTVTAMVTKDGAPLAGKVVTFTIADGPHSPGGGTATSDAAGMAAFTYTGTMEGTDVIYATFIDDTGRLQTSNRVTKTWGGEGPPPPPTGDEVSVLIKPTGKKRTKGIVYSNAGKLTTGNYTITRGAKGCTALEGGGAIPGKKGESADIAFNIDRVGKGKKPYYEGVIMIHDGSTDLMFDVAGNVSCSGNVMRGNMTTTIDGKKYAFRFVVTDAPAPAPTEE